MQLYTTWTEKKDLWIIQLQITSKEHGVSGDLLSAQPSPAQPEVFPSLLPGLPHSWLKDCIQTGLPVLVMLCCTSVRRHPEQCRAETLPQGLELAGHLPSHRSALRRALVYVMPSWNPRNMTFANTFMYKKFSLCDLFCELFFFFMGVCILNCYESKG